MVTLTYALSDSALPPISTVSNVDKARAYRAILDLPAAQWPAWNAFVDTHPDGHLLQLSDWGCQKTAFGWTARIVAVIDHAEQLAAGALVLFRRLPLRIGTRGYIAAGPLFASPDPQHPANQMLWQAIHSVGRQHHAAFIKIEPCDWYRPRPDLAGQLKAAGCRPSLETIQPPRTIVVDISDSEADILARMNQSTRYKIKTSGKKDVVFRHGTQADVASFTHLMSLTGRRDHFTIYPPDYYEMAFRLFAPEQRCTLLMASYAGRDLAGLMAFRCGSNAYYLYGASSNEERNRMPTYGLQWEAIRWAKAHGAIRYDLWGIPDVTEASLEENFEQRRDGLWGVYGMKRGFGGQVVRSIGAWDLPLNPLLYALYRWYLIRSN